MKHFKLGIHRDARPQATFLLTAAALSILLWFIPLPRSLLIRFVSLSPSYMKADMLSPLW